MTSTERAEWILRASSVVLLFGAWEVLAHVLGSLLFPTFTATVQALARLVSTGSFWSAIWTTHQALLVGFGSALALGTILGLAMGRWRSLERLVDPYLNLLLATPISALIPVIILAIGLGLPSRALVVFLFSFSVIVVNTRAGLKTVEPTWIEMARGFCATEGQLWRTILIPGSLPAMMTGWYLGLGRALTGMIAVEMLLVAVGIGRLILDYQGMFAADLLYATISFVVAEAVLLLHGLKWLERRLTPWADLVTIE